MANKPCNTIEFQDGQVILRGPGVTYVIPWTGDAPLDAAAINARFDAQDARQAEHDAKLDALIEAMNRLAGNIFVMSSMPGAPTPAA